MVYSLDFRSRVLSIKEKRALTFQRNQWTFRCGHTNVIPLAAIARAKDETQVKPATKIDMLALEEDLEKNPDRFQYERALNYGISQAAIFYALNLPK